VLRPSSRNPSVPPGVFLVLAFIAFLAFYVARMLSWEEVRQPPAPGDAPDYDNMALQIVRGHGFAHDDTDQEWRKPYAEYNPGGIYDDLLSRRLGLRSSTYRPPLMPLMLAATYRVFGRSFLAWRMVDCVFISAGLTLALAVAWTTFGSYVALISTILMFLSSSYLNTIGYYGVMTEPLALFLASLLLWTLAGGRMTLRRACAAGIAFALLVLTRSFYVVWLPALPLIVAWMSRQSGMEMRAAVRTAVFCTLAVLVCLAPWCIRNIALTRAFMPFGTQAGLNMYAAYSDQALKKEGWWFGATREEMGRTYVRELGEACTGCTELELARFSMRGGAWWALGHWQDLPRLFWGKIKHTLIRKTDAGQTGRFYWLSLAAPLIIWRRRRAIHWVNALVMLLFVVLNLVAIGLTWSTGWRFLLPVEPVMAVMTALTLTVIVFGEDSIRATEISSLND
jgi:hypothetical protein